MKNGQKNKNNNGLFSLFPAPCAGPPRKAPKRPPGALPRSLPEPFGDLLGGKTAQRGPSGAELPPKREASRRPFWPPRGSILEPPGADFRGLSRFICSLPESSFDCFSAFPEHGPRSQNSKQQLANRPSKQPLATKRLASNRWSAVFAARRAQ